MNATAVMTDCDAFLAAIRAAPADDAPRLILADHLDEIGESDYASFIRCQCELARLEEYGEKHRNTTWMDGPNDEWRKTFDSLQALRERERQLWNASRLNGAPHPWFPRSVAPRIYANWLSSHDEPVMTVHPGGQKIEMRLARGFVDRVELTLAAFYGEPCGRCGREDAETRAREDAWRGKCPACSGSGRTPGAAAGLGRLPLRADGIKLTCRAPADGNGFHYWYREGRDEYPHLRPAAQLPDELMDVLVEQLGQPDADPHAGLVGFRTRDAADRALSAACLALTLARAGRR